ncbi:3-oxo-5-alpha-steroid 4-dehydrogenase-domain-containing protein [Chytridium lagenaria]|nr:3-oxo-5-alpha-steroid 4-dehydrogenase-domain-containing protein [Chytridium lagenaria]
MASVIAMLSDLVYIGPVHLPHLSIIGLQDQAVPFILTFAAIFAVTFSWLQSNPSTELAYSKFAQGRSWKISSRTGMPLLYMPACLISLLGAKYLSNASTPRVQLVNHLLAAHFAKRTLESLYIHQYSGWMGVLDVMFISSIYASVSYLNHISTLYAYLENPTFFDNQSKDVAYVGIALFFIGALGNLRHHLIMASWRKDGKTAEEKTKYVVPKGGMFVWVACPHYFFEIIMWLGVAIAGSTLYAWFPFFATAVNLIPKAARTSAWYKSKMEDYPKNRKHIIPFIY